MNEQEFMCLTWDVTPQGNYTLRLSGHDLAIMRGMTCMPTYTLSVDGEIITHYLDRRITDVESAKKAAWKWYQEVTECTTK